jgi:AbiJ N-terminal domain 4
MARFSQRVGGRRAFSSGLEEASKDLRTATWNALHARLFPTDNGSGSSSWKRYRAIATELWAHLNWPTDQIPIHAFEGRELIKKHWFDDWDWLDFFDTFEFCVSLLAPDARFGDSRADWFDEMNEPLISQGCAYRFLGEELGPVSNPIEVAAVEEAIESSVAPVSKHIRDAIRLLPPSPNASPRNSIKESISAVEAALKHLTDSPSATLGEGLKAFEAAYGPMHDSIRRGLTHLYAYTNGPDGIRHALIEDSAEVTVDDARFMLIACSAVANYLVAVANG